MKQLDRGWRKVLTVDLVESKYARRGQGTWVLHLACGHEAYRKTSVRVPKRVRCGDCA
jgi:hypothetical protein